ncbi:phosphoribosylformylglycinamidine synthase-like, partial [Saccoglossus kowalevskii]
ALIWVDISGGHHRLGGTALAQCYNQLGNVSPDLDEPQLLVKAFNVTQQLIKDRLLTAGHDISDGGLITCILEMAFAGNCGMDINFNTSKNSVSVTELLFSEELGLIIEAQEENVDSVIKSYKSQNVPCHIIGSSQGQGQSAKVCVSVDDKKVLEEKTTELRRIWEETSFRLERLQSNPQCVEEEETNFGNRTAPLYKMSFDPSVMPAILKNLS